MSLEGLETSQNVLNHTKKKIMDFQTREYLENKWYEFKVVFLSQAYWRKLVESLVCMCVYVGWGVCNNLQSRVSGKNIS